MKNIHIIPTEKPSRLAYDFDKLVLNSRLLSPILYKTQNIYITSDEEIKEDVDQWYLDKFLNKPRNSSGSQYAEKQDVIILTTDQDLIKDGVQAIDDEFLEWFVKNPSCEEVEVEKGYAFGTFYKIIIPIEERKKNFYCGDEVDYDDKCLEQCDRCVDATGVDYGYLPKEQPKYPIGGYAPGNYMCNCSTCKIQFQGDKRAVQCEPCAIKMVQKQNIINMMKGDEELGLYDEILPEQIWNEEKKKGVKEFIDKHKKETLEEVAENFWLNDDSMTDNDRISYVNGFGQGAKWNQDKICNSEVLQRIRASKSDAEARRIIRTI